MRTFRHRHRRRRAAPLSPHSRVSAVRRRRRWR